MYDIPSFMFPAPKLGQRIDAPIYAVPDGAAHQIKNFIPRDGELSVRPGYTQVGSNLVTPITGMIKYTDVDGTDRFVVARAAGGATDGGWFAWDIANQAWVDITDSADPLAGTLPNFQVFRLFYKAGVCYLVGCNGYSDTPKCWDSDDSNDYAEVGGTPGSPKCMGVLANRMIMANFSDAPVQVDVSEFNDFEDGWGAVQLVNLADTPGEIVAIQEMGNLMAVLYKSDAIYTINASATLDPFTFVLKFADVAGPLSVKSIVTAQGGIHLVFANDYNIYRYDGASYMPMGDHISDHVRRNINFDRANRAFGFYNSKHSEAWFLWPGVGMDYPTQGMAVKQDGSVWPVEFSGFYPTAGSQFNLTAPITIGDLTQPLSYYTSPLSDYDSVQSFHVLGDSVGDVFSESGNTDDGDAIPITLMTGMTAPSKDHKMVLVGQSEYFLEPSPGGTLTHNLLYSDDDAGTYTEDTDQTISLGAKGPHTLGSRRTSRFFGVKLSGSISTQLTFEGVRVSGVERGWR